MIIQGANIPLYIQLKQSIQDQINSGKLAVDEMLPGEREIANSLDLSRTTVRLALNELVSEGVLYRHHGKGTFVARKRHRPNTGLLTGFAEELRSRGLAPTVQVLAAEIQKTDAFVASHLNISVDEPIAFVQRLVSIDARPLFTDRTFIVSPVGPLILGADLQNESIYNIIERLGYPIRAGEQTISAITLSEHQAELLAAKSGDPALLIRRVTFIEPDKPIEYSEAVYRGDSYEYSMHLQRKPDSAVPSLPAQPAANMIGQ